MDYLAQILGGALGITLGNPLSLLICLIMCLSVRKKWMIFVSSLISSIILEFIIINRTYRTEYLGLQPLEFGDRILFTFVGCLIFSSLVYFIIFLFSFKSKDKSKN